MNKIITALLLICTSRAYAEMVKIAVIDTGIDAMGAEAPLCRESKDFTGSGLADHHGHGSHISDIINQQVTGKIRVDYRPTSKIKTYKYCQLIIKFYEERFPPRKADNTAELSAESILFAIENKVKIINYSGGGSEYSRPEYLAVKKALDAGIIFVAAAGNYGEDLQVHPFYPAAYDRRIVVVGNSVKSPNFVNRHSTSNFGFIVDFWDLGTNIIAKTMGGKIVPMTGTSQATAARSGKILKSILLGQ